MGWLSPRLWGLHALVVAAVAFTVSLGLWQMGVYDDRRAEAGVSQQDAPAKPLSEVLEPDDPFTTSAGYQHVTFSGTYGPADEQVWVYGREQDGHNGYWLVAPVVVDGAESTSDRPAAMLVVRGWRPEIGAGAFPAVPTGTVAIEAVLQPGDARGGAFDEDTRTLDGVRIPRLVNAMPYDLYGGYGIVTTQDPADTAGLTPAEIPPPVVDSTAGIRNLFYAIEWWIFGAFAIFMWWRMCQDVRRSGRGGGPQPSRVPAAKRAAHEAARARAAGRQPDPREDTSSVR
ncbi:SURF1 family protein [Mumia zhuanghuii]|uniref:SURF1-like protein n=2 Tax=Mumia TaxID=1546255 RepID=A0ABW1QLU1_9ACTN|nr:MULTISPECIES: SURF1 family protein [Mumia]KAA1424864.1 SURF1 family protein [Mumia zhuanghuii]